MGIIQIEGHTFHPGFLNEKSLVFDLGANRGAFARQIVERFHCRCIAVEANASLAALVARIPNMEVIHAAIGDSERVAELAVTENDQCSSVLEPTTSKILQKEKVNMLSLQGLFDRVGVSNVDLIKMDIEGAEIMALGACPDRILKGIGQLAVEFHDSLGMTMLLEIEKIAAHFRSLGFEWIRGTFSNYEDNLFINRDKCPLTCLELLGNRTVFRVLNGLKRVIRRTWQHLP